MLERRVDLIIVVDGPIESHQTADGLCGSRECVCHYDIPGEVIHIISGHAWSRQAGWYGTT